MNGGGGSDFVRVRAGSIPRSALSYAEWISIGGDELLEEFELLLRKAYGEKVEVKNEEGLYSYTS
jgi:hypothetical protein